MLSQLAGGVQSDAAPDAGFSGKPRTSASAGPAGAALFTLCRRAAGLALPQSKPHPGLVQVVIESTGLKVFGEGGWKARLHGYSRRRGWRKLHPGVDEATGEVLAHKLTAGNVNDGPVLPELLAMIGGPLEQVSADEAYDSFANHRAILVRPVIPPSKRAAIAPPPGVRDPPPTWGGIVKRITGIGSKAWKVEAGYHRRSLAGTAMYRTQTLIGPALESRTLPNQKTEAAITVNCLNRFTVTGMPLSVKIG